MPPSAIIDESRLEPLRELYGAELPDLVRGFLARMDELSAALHEAVGAGDGSAAFEAAHRLGGSAAMFGAVAVEALSRQTESLIEMRLASGTSDPVADVSTAPLMRAVAEATRALEQILASG